MFLENTTTQMAAKFLTLAGGRLTRTDLMSLLYAADRRMLIERGALIAYDQWLSTKEGPVLAATLELIRLNGTLPSYWSDYITTSGDSVLLIADPGDDDLSPANDKVIEKTFREWWPQPLRPVKSRFPEWRSPSGPPELISYAEVLQMNGFSQDEAAEIALGNEVQDVPHHYRRIVLGNRDRDEFIRSLEADSEPNEAAQDFNQRHGN